MRLSRRLGKPVFSLFVAGCAMVPAVSRADAVLDVTRSSQIAVIDGLSSDYHDPANPVNQTYYSDFTANPDFIHGTPMQPNFVVSFPQVAGGDTADTGVATFSSSSSTSQHFTPNADFPGFSHFDATMDGSASASLDAGATLPADVAYIAQTAFNTQIYFSLSSPATFTFSGHLSSHTTGNPDPTTPSGDSGGTTGLDVNLSDSSNNPIASGSLFGAGDGAPVYFFPGGIAFGPDQTFSFTGTLGPGEYSLNLHLDADAGVAGSVTSATSSAHLDASFDLVSVPLPSTAMSGGLLILALAAFGYFRRRVTA